MLTEEYESTADLAAPHAREVIPLLNESAIVRESEWNLGRSKHLDNEILRLHGLGLKNQQLAFWHAMLLVRQQQGEPALAEIIDLAQQMNGGRFGTDLAARTSMWRIELSTSQKREIPPAYVEEYLNRVTQSLRTIPDQPSVCGYLLGYAANDLSPDGNAGKCVQGKLDSIFSDKAIPEYVRLSLQGAIEIDIAWNERGGGWGNEVTEAGARGFSEHLALARKFLVKAQAAEPRCPFAASRLITVCRGEGSGHREEREWFDRAFKATPDFNPAWHNLRQGWLPRWGGSHADILALGRLALATHRFDTEVPYEFIESYETIMQDLSSMEQPLKPFLETPGLWEDILKLYNGYGAVKSRDELLRQRDQGDFAALAYRFGKTDVFKKAVLAGGVKEVDGERFSSWAGVTLEEAMADLKNPDAKDSGF